MIRRAFALSTAALLALVLAPVGTVHAEPDRPDDRDRLTPADATRTGSAEKGTVLSLGRGSGPQLYVVQLEDPAVPAYDGGIAGLAASAGPNGEFRPESSRAQAYRDHLRAEQGDLRSAIAKVTGERADIAFSYTDSLNAIAVRLTRAEARKVAEVAGVAAVQVDEKRQLQTDVGPEWIGAPAIWDGSGTPAGAAGATKGEGIVAGIIDSGINPANPSFADVVSEEDGGDGHDHTNPLGSGNYLGFCDPASPQYDADFVCNDKLIGGYAFTGDPSVPFDDNGHGTHTASTTAGNQIDATTYAARGTEHEFSATRRISGVAPHANIIAYDVCAGGCSLAAINAAINQAILDDVDVINYSIGSTAASSPWTDTDTLGFLNARDAGIHVATSAGNAGPGAATVGAPGDVPWMTTVGAVQHNRQWQSSVEDITAAGGATHPDIQGLGFSAATDGAFPLVDAGEAPYDNPLCGIDGGTGGDGTFPAGTDLTGLIIVCDRGVSGRVEKGGNVASLGAEGMVLVNDAPSGDSLNGDPHALPTAHVGFADGTALKEWMTTVEGEQASISGGTEAIDESLGDIMAGFSSRGPNRAVDIVSPSVSAPGVDVLAAEGADNDIVWGFISGTSMASPHVAGSFALLDDVHPDWTPAQMQSALMTTSKTEVTDNDGTPADWFDMGSGREDLTVAANAGLVLDETEADYLAANPAAGGDPKTLNLASMADSQCLQACSWTRTVTGTSTGAGTWTATGSSVTDGITVSVSPASFTLAEGATQELTITADVAGASTDEYQFGAVTLTHGGAAPEAHLPVAALPSTGVLPDEIVIDTRRDAGSQESEPIESIASSDLQTDVSGLAPATEQELSIPEDSTNTDPYDGNGTVTTLVQVPADASRLIASLADSTAPDMDLFVGTGSEPSAATQVCSSATATADEFCDVGDPEAGTWWVLVQNWDASSPGATDTVTLGTAVVAGDAGNMTVEGPASTPAGEPYTLRVFYDEEDLDAGETWYGAITLGSSAGSPGDIGTIPVTLNRFADDVTKSVDADTAEPGDTLTYTLEVQPNVTPEDLRYTITDTLPEGTTYVEGSATGGATVSDGVLTWEPLMPTAVGAEGDYAMTTSGVDPSCVNPFTGTAEYLDLAAISPIRAQPGIVGDGVAFTTAFGGREFGLYEDSYVGVSFTDDGFLLHDVAANYGGDPAIPQTMPDAAQPNNVVAGLWQDMQIVYDQAANHGVSLATAGDIAIVEYDDLRLADDPSGAEGTYDMEAFLVAGSRDYVFVYDNLSGPMAGPLTIGVEDAEGDRGTGLVSAGSAQGVITNDTVVCATYQGPDLAAQQITYEVTVDGDVDDGEVLVNEAVHVTDNPGAKEVTVSTDVTVALPEVTVAGTRDAEEPDTDGAFTFTRPDGSSDRELTVAYEIGGNARAGKDYVRLDGEVTFAAGESTASEVVEVIDRPGRQKKARTIEVTVQPGAGYTAGEPASASIEVIDNDGKPGKR